MVKILIVYDSHTKNTEAMAKAVEQGAKNAGAEVLLKKVNKAGMEDLEWADGIVLGSPTYFGNMTGRMKSFVDKSVSLYGEGKLRDKVGAAFASAAGTGTGVEMTVLSLITALAMHDMVIVSAPGREEGWPGMLGTMADGLGYEDPPNKVLLESCKMLGARVADVSAKLIG